MQNLTALEIAAAGPDAISMLPDNISNLKRLEELQVTSHCDCTDASQHTGGDGTVCNAVLCSGNCLVPTSPLTCRCTHCLELE